MMAERNLDFNMYVDRRNTDCLKYDFAKRRGLPEDVLPLWVADMDFRTSSYVEEALVERAKNGVFGYTESGEDYFQAVAGWMERHHSWKVRQEYLIKTPGVVFALAMAVRAFTREGDNVLIQQPVYYPFSEVILENGRNAVSSDLYLENGRNAVSSDLYLGEDNRYHIDFEDFERKIEKNDIGLFLMCSPHNPVGRVWTRDELMKIGEICVRHNVIVVSDEIHNDFIFEGEHHVFATLSPELEQISVICTAPSKTFNLAAMMLSNIFIPDVHLRKRFLREVSAAGVSLLSAFGLTACQAAYEHGEQWYQAMLSYVRGNIEYVYRYAQEHFKKIRVVHLEGTYLMWLDFRGTGLSSGEIDQKIIYEAKLWLDSGKIFGSAGKGFQRINTACQRATLEEAMERIRRTFEA